MFTPRTFAARGLFAFGGWHSFLLDAGLEPAIKLFLQSKRVIPPTDKP